MTGALELLQQLFRTPPPELLHALTASGGIAQVSVSKDECASRSRSGSIVELIGKLYFLVIQVKGDKHTPPALFLSVSQKYEG